MSPGRKLDCFGTMTEKAPSHFDTYLDTNNEFTDITASEDEMTAIVRKAH